MDYKTKNMFAHVHASRFSQNKNKNKTTKINSQPAEKK
jgi:hypothetical protein